MSIIDNILRNYFYNDVLKIIQEYMHLTGSLKYLYDCYNKAKGISKKIINSYIMHQQIDICNMTTHIHNVSDDAEYLINTKQFKYNGKMTKKILVYFVVDTPWDDECRLYVKPIHYLAVSSNKLYRVIMNYNGIEYFKWIISNIYYLFGKEVRYDW